MGCFLTCFCGTSKSKLIKRRHLVAATATATPCKHHRHGSHETKQALQVTEPLKQGNIEKLLNPIVESIEKLDQPLSCSTKKKVTFDLNVKTYDEVSTEEFTDILLKNNGDKESQKKEDTPKESECVSASAAAAPEIASYPANHRYEYYVNNYHEFEDLHFEESDCDDDDNGSECHCKSEGGDDKILVQEESSESLFSLSIESRKQGCEVELGEKEVTSPMPKSVSTNEQQPNGSNGNGRDPNQHVNSVLNPVENINQWRAVKAKAKPPLKYEAKENISVEPDENVHFSSPDPSFKLPTHSPRLNSRNNRLVDQEIAVDTSLSGWLVESETMPKFKSSPNSVGNTPAKSTSSPRSEDRQILGVLTIEEPKQHSACMTPRQSRRNQSPAETPILGTVGSYWSHTGQVVDSDSSSASEGMAKLRTKTKEHERMNWNQTPFEVKLDRAVDRGTVEV